MYRREHRDHLSFKDFFLPFGGQVSEDNRWIKLAEVIPWDELEDDYAPKFCKGFGAPAKPFPMALGALIIKARLGLTVEELVEQIKENPYLQFFIGLEGYQYSAPFDPPMMVYYRKRLPESVVNDCNERIVRHGLNVICSSAPNDHDDYGNQGGGDARPADQEIGSKTTQPNQRSLLIDATCVPADNHPTDLSLLNEARELTETLIDAMHSQVRGAFGHKPRTHRKLARQQFLAVAKKKKPRINNIRKAIRQQLVISGVIWPVLTHYPPVAQAFWRLGDMPTRSCWLSASWSFSRPFLTSLTAEVFLTASLALARLMSGRSCVARHAAMLSLEQRSPSW
jgi:transposase, IS5 family